MLSVTTFWSFQRAFSRRTVLNSIQLIDLPGPGTKMGRNEDGAMETKARTQKTYDHRLKELVRSTQDITTKGTGMKSFV